MKRYRVKPGEKVNLADWDPADTKEFSAKKKEAQQELLKLNTRIDELQELLYAERKHKILIILQAMDTGGKDGTIKSVFQSVDPLGIGVTSFKAPVQEELEHDYLWRVHTHVPSRGELVIFNRSHYEDVLVVRVHTLVPTEQWQRRYEQINNFEHMLAEEGTTILKFFLHISKDEQKERLQARLDDKTKHWKFNMDDVKERKLWPDYMKAYEEVLSKTSTEWAPWYVVPSNRKWYRNIVVATVIVNTLEGLNMKYPKPVKRLKKISIP